MKGEKMKPAAKMPQSRPVAPRAKKTGPQEGLGAWTISPGSGMCRCSLMVLLGDVEECRDEGEGEDGGGEATGDQSRGHVLACGLAIHGRISIRDAGPAVAGS